MVHDHEWVGHGPLPKRRRRSPRVQSSRRRWLRAGVTERAAGGSGGSKARVGDVPVWHLWQPSSENRVVPRRRTNTQLSHAHVSAHRTAVPPASATQSRKEQDSGLCWCTATNVLGFRNDSVRFAREARDQQTSAANALHVSNSSPSCPLVHTVLRGECFAAQQPPCGIGRAWGAATSCTRARFRSPTCAPLRRAATCAARPTCLAPGTRHPRCSPCTWQFVQWVFTEFFPQRKKKHSPLTSPHSGGPQSGPLIKILSRTDASTRSLWK
ncbi:uncharacterized protein [Dermacentor albipictus]|uniref:uncharacterized protein isoform X5 n=1 Tax=Dermacentor albipictus TaxID=60249 RepID=UPI0038FC07FD